MPAMTPRSAIKRGIQAVSTLAGAFGSYLLEIAPPTGDNMAVDRFVLFVLLVIFFAISVLTERALKGYLRTVWIAIAIALAIAMIPVFFWYMGQFNSYTFLFPPDGDNRFRIVAGLEMRQEAIDYLESERAQGRYLSNSQLLDDFGGVPNIGDIWPPESIRVSLSILTWRYLVFASLLAGTVFSFVEIFRIGKKEPEEPPGQEGEEE